MAATTATPEATDLREGLHAAGVTLRDLAVHLGVTEGAVHQQLTGRRPLQRRTADAARELIEERITRLVKLTGRLAAAVGAKARAEDRDGELAALAETLALPLTRIERVPGQQSTYRFHVAGKVVTLRAEAVFYQGRFRAAVRNVCGLEPAKQRGAAWDDTLRAFYRAAEVVTADAATIG